MPSFAAANFRLFSEPWPWLPGDFFHVVDDDLLPIFATMKHLCFGDVDDECFGKYSLALVEDVNMKLYGL